MNKIVYELRGNIKVLIYKKINSGDHKNIRLIERCTKFIKNQNDIEKLIMFLKDYTKCCFLFVNKNVLINSKILTEVVNLEGVDMCLLKDESYIIFKDSDNVEIKTKNDNSCILLTCQGLEKLLLDTPNYLGVHIFIIPILLFILFMYIIESKDDERNEISKKI